MHLLHTGAILHLTAKMMSEGVVFAKIMAKLFGAANLSACWETGFKYINKAFI